jgi:hypothetical protein
MMNVSTDGGRAELRTRERGRYVAGTSAEVGFGMRITSSPFTGNQRCRWGYFDDFNGMYFQKDASGLSVNLIRDGIITLSVPQSEWNVDKMDGTGPSGVVLDLAKGNIFQVVYTWYGYGAIVYRIVITNNGNQYVQTVHGYSPNGSTSVKNPNLPLTADLSNLDVTDPTSTTAIEAYVAGRQYSIIGDVGSTNTRLTNAYVLNTDVTSADFVSVLNIRRKAGYVGNPIRMLSVEVLTPDSLMFQVRINGIDIGSQTSSFGAIPDTSQRETALEQDSTATTLNDQGTVLYAAIVSASGGKGNTPPSVTNRTFDQVIEEDDIVLQVRRRSL